jgi:hypothetical protein
MASDAGAKGKDQFKSLLDTIETLRKAKHPNLDQALVRDILRMHTDGRTSDADIARGASQAAERVLRGKS